MLKAAVEGSSCESSWLELSLSDAHRHPPRALPAQTLHTHSSCLSQHICCALVLSFLAFKVSSEPGSALRVPALSHRAGPGQAPLAAPLRSHSGSASAPATGSSAGGGGSEDAPALSRHSAAAQGGPEPSSRHHHHSRGTIRVSPGMRARCRMETQRDRARRTELAWPGGARPL